LRLLTLVIAFGAFTAQVGHAQAPGARLVEVRAEPKQPSFGEKFDLHVTLRLRPGVVAFLPDTLLPTQSVQSVVGKAAWTEARVSGDSVEVRATYPLIGFRAGPVELPRIELWLRRAAASDVQGEKTARRAADVPKGTRAGLERRVIRLGGTQVRPFQVIADSGAEVAPRPPADVLGAEWSLWLLLAVGIASIVGVIGAGTIVRWWWAAKGRALLSRLRGRSPRQDALRELERILALGWHRNGRMTDFYESSTGTLRRFATATDPVWSPALTSTELLTRLSERWGAGGIESLASTVAIAERVKFGAFQPGADAAEGDWRTIFEWIRDRPKG
jgi:hypothetical protein